MMLVRKGTGPGVYTKTDPFGTEGGPEIGPYCEQNAYLSQLDPFGTSPV